MASMAEAVVTDTVIQQPTLYAADMTLDLFGHNVDHNVARSQYKQDANTRDRDSGVFLSDSEDLPMPPPPLPSSLISPISLKRIGSIKPAPSAQRTDSPPRRLRRPAELNLQTTITTTTTADDPKPKSELELRYDLIRNSQNKSKAALKSPTQLLRDRLNLSPKKAKFEEKFRIFTPPQPMLNGCILPGPAAQMQAFAGSSVRARTEKMGRPAWWCKVDRVVVFDGVEKGEGDECGEMKFKTRTSKGLTIARRRGDTETVVIPLDCGHCQEMLNRHEWKYDVQVCKRVVCWDCRERCKWEMEQERADAAKEIGGAEQGTPEVNRVRSDSMLQDEQVLERTLRETSGIECVPKVLVNPVIGSSVGSAEGFAC